VPQVKLKNSFTFRYQKDHW